MSELLPCPFCGGEAKVFHYSSAIRDEVWRVVCDKPFCAQGPDGYTEAEAIAAWNTRADDYRQAAEYWQRMYEDKFRRTCKREKHGRKMDGSWRMRCSECGYGIGDKRWSHCPSCGARIEVGE